MALTLLLVDDDVVDRMAIRRALKEAGVLADCHEVADADAALAALQSQVFDCVLLDYRLPKTDGLELLKRIQASGITTPVIALTGQGDEQLAVEMMRAGASDYLAKQSLSADRLHRSLRHAIAMAQVEADRRQALERERIAREEAQAANRAKDEFLATLSHELRTPLNAILGWARLLAAGGLDETKIARAVSTIERNALAQAKLIEDLLDISRVETGKMELDLAPLELTAFTDGLVESFRPHASGTGLSLTYECRAAVCLVRADAARLEQILGNLIANAIKFTPAGGAVTVSLEVAGGTAIFRVRDTGLGLDPAFLPHAFERFRQANTGPTRQHGGLGLGLAIVQHLTRMHGGDVGVHSDGLNRGAEFTVSLPVLTGDEEEATGTARPVSGPALSLAGIRVMAVDDEVDALGLMEALLAARGAQVMTARSVAEALATLERDAPDVVVSDIAMPGADGYSLIAAIRRSSSAAVRDVPVVAVTAYATAADRLRALHQGFDAHVTKPIDTGHLVALVGALASRRGAPRP